MTISENIPHADRPPVDELTYEQAFSELEEIVSALESNGQTLDGAVALFERAQALAGYCASLLDQAELKIQQLSGEELEDFNPED